MVFTFKHDSMVLRLSVAAMVGCAVLATASDTSHAQSGTRRPTPPAASGQAPTGSATRDSAASAQVALDGYCPVCILEMKKWVRGNPEYQVRYDGKTYYFPSDAQRQMFLADPAKYVPALGGDCTVCFVNMGKRMPGKIHFAALYQGRLFLFPSAEQKTMFLSDPAKYADADLALGGKCPVCRVEMNKDVPGKPEIAAFYHGMRYLFPSDEQRKVFLASPEKY